MGDKVTIAQARVRRTDPAWRRRHKVADLVGIGLVVLLLVLPPLAASLAPAAGLTIVAALLVVAAAALSIRGPAVGIERRAALLVAVPGLNILVLVPAVWRAAHLHLQRWQGPLQPAWDETTWTAVGAAAALVWVAGIAGLIWALA